MPELYQVLEGPPMGHPGFPRHHLMGGAGMTATPQESVSHAGQFIPKDKAQLISRAYEALFYDSDIHAAVAASAIAAGGKLNFFQTGSGNSSATSPVFGNATGTQKGFADTNLETSGGQLPYGVSFVADSIGVQLFPVVNGANSSATIVWSQSPIDYAMILSADYLEVGGTSTRIPLGPIWHWPAGYGPYGNAYGVSTANNVTQYGMHMVNGYPSFTARKKFGIAVSFNFVQAFRGTVRNDAAINQINVVRWGVQVAWSGLWGDVIGG